MVGLSGLITPSLEEMCQVAAEMERRGLQIPLLIGGATTSATHTALRIDPLYSQGVVHVPDASRAAGVARTLMDPHLKPAFLEKYGEDYERRRRSIRAGTSINKEITLAEARLQGTKLDWHGYQPPQPAFLGRKVLSPYPIADLLERIDWTPLFQAWELPGTFPAILDHANHGQQARELWADAQALLQEVQAENLLEARAVLGFFPAVRHEDDIAIDLGQEGCLTFPQLRQQLPKSSGKAQFCLADFVAPQDSGKQDYLGLFAVSAGFGMEEATARFKAGHDEYRAMLLQCLGDRLAEALAERLHEKTRRLYWGYAAEEQFSNQELIAECYRGIRPAPGYPACPDHRLKRLIWQALQVASNIGLHLTDSCAMWPSAAVSGFYFSHPQSHYFGVGRIGQDQLQDYAARWGENPEASRPWLSQLLPLPDKEAVTSR
jgi:5-methyltetrahydrofolate--homocysteine methyltransferase